MSSDLHIEKTGANAAKVFNLKLFLDSFWADHLY